MPPTYGKTSWRGIYACGCMIQLIEDVVEPRLKAAGFATPIAVFQGAYNTSVGASAGTHAGGGSIDTGKYNDAGTIIWRESGVADWQRGDPEDPHFDDHNHGIWQGCPHLSGDAAGQVDQYEAGCDGLSGWGPDQSPHVAPISWQDAYDQYAGTTGTEGLLGMTTAVNDHRTKDTGRGMTDDFKDLMINDDDGYTVITGPIDQVTATANVHVSGLEDGETFDIQWRIAKYKQGAETTYSHTRPSRRMVGNDTGCLVTCEATYNGGLPKADSGYSSRLRLAYRTTSQTAVVKDIYIEGWRTDS
jgi:hypothetical protein